ncbi:MAG: fimbria/pilus periplasmic chaperone [Nitrospirota bacterium]
MALKRSLRGGHRFGTMALCVLFFLGVLGQAAYAAQFRVTPVRVDLDKNKRSGTVNLINEGTESVRLQVSAVRWTQDARGKDQYAETDELVFFPKVMVLGPGEKRLIRVGVNAPAGAVEKTYRLFVEEIPQRKKDSEGFNVTVALRFGVPVFVAPAKEAVAGDIKEVSLKDGKLRVTVADSGNVHFMITSIEVTGVGAQGEEVFSRELSGWYLLSGAERSYQTSIDTEECKEIAGLEVKVKTDRVEMRRKVDVDGTGCPR